MSSPPCLPLGSLQTLGAMVIFKVNILFLTPSFTLVFCWPDIADVPYVPESLVCVCVCVSVIIIIILILITLCSILSMNYGDTGDNVTSTCSQPLASTFFHSTRSHRFISSQDDQSENTLGECYLGIMCALLQGESAHTHTHTHTHTRTRTPPVQITHTTPLPHHHLMCGGADGRDSGGPDGQTGVTLAVQTDDETVPSSLMLFCGGER